MLYIWRMTVPADTAKDEPKEIKKKIRIGIIKRLEIFMPNGCHGKVSGTISHRLLQLLPFNVEEAVKADGYSVVGNYNIDIRDAEPELILRGWSPDTLYEHEVTYRANIVQAEEEPIKTLAEIMKGLFEKPKEEKYPI